MQCIKNKTEEIEILMHSLKVQPFFLCVSEHWCTAEEKLSLQVENYSLASAYCRENSIHGGSSIFVLRDALIVEEIEDFRKKSIEGIIECSSIICKASKLIIICIYRPPKIDKESIEIFLNCLSDLLDIIQDKFGNYKVIIAGDFNIHMENSNNNTTNMFLNLLLSHNFSQTIFQPTRFTQNTQSILDNIFINFNSQHTGEVIKTALSDHEGQLLKIDVETPNYINKNKIKQRIFSDVKLNHFKYELRNINWNDIYIYEDPNLAYSHFFNKIKFVFEKLFPKKTIRFKNNSKQWITQGIKKSCKTKRLLYEKTQNGEITSEYYKKYCSILKSVVSEAKKNQNLAYIENATNKCTATWNLIRQFTGSKQSETVSILNNIHINNNNNSMSLLNQVNEHFTNKCVTKSSIQHKTLDNKFDKNIYLIPATPQEIYRTIMSLKNTKSVGDDEIPVKLLKFIVDEIAEPLAYIVNLTLSSGIFPENFKVSLIKAIYKKGNKTEINNYRPVALLSNVSKIFEKIIYNRLITFLEHFQILSDTQNGFRKNKSTIRALYQALCSIFEERNNKKNTIAVYLDLSKAFDNVDHSILVDKIEHYGIRGTAKNLIKSYLSNRTQCVFETDSNSGEQLRSEKRVIQKGVPQGSILGPLLYLIYTNDVAHAITEKTIIQYADDTSTIISNDSKINLERETFETLDTLEQYFKAINLELNKEKTKIINFSYRNYEKQTFSNANTVLTTVDEVTFLGIKLDSRLDWKCHINYLIQNVARYCYALKIIAKNINLKAAFTVYHSYIHSRLRYGIIFWGNSSEVNNVFILQKKCLRNILTMKSTESCKEKFIANNILTVPCLYIYEAILFVKENNSLFDIHKKQHTHNTRNKNDLNTTTPNFTFVQKNVPYSIIKIYNKLPETIRNLSLKEFKSKLKIFLTKKAYYTMDEYFNDIEMEHTFFQSRLNVV